MNAPRGKFMDTYKRADGELIYGEYGWMGEPDCFDDDDEPTEVVAQRWMLVEQITYTHHPTGYRIGCETCETEGELADGIECGSCDGEGYVEPPPNPELSHPKARVS